MVKDSWTGSLFLSGPSWQSPYDLQRFKVCHWQQSGTKQKARKVTLKPFYGPASAKKRLPLESLFPSPFTFVYTWKMSLPLRWKTAKYPTSENGQLSYTCKRYYATVT